jgi:hypothetical protein
MNTLVANISDKSCLDKLRYTLEKAGFKITETYNGDLVIWVFTK